MKMKLRLALREENGFWNAYMAKEDSMEDARLIGSIIMGAVQQDGVIKAQFMNLMKEVMGHAIETVTGEAPDRWDVKPAPPDERKH